jgi:tetratricopeptide (TPR) repeat protein
MWLCKHCNEELKDTFDVCWNCGASREGTPPVNHQKFKKIKEQSIKELKVIEENKGVKSTLGSNYELYNYIINARGISLIGLNVMAFIGIFVFGWLIFLIFQYLGKKVIPWIYQLVLIFLFLFSIRIEPKTFLLYLIVYVIAWVHANLILYKYKSMAKERIEEINSLSKTDVTSFLEKGAIYYKVIRSKETAFKAFTEATKLHGGDVDLLFFAGKAMYRNYRIEEANQLFKRALLKAKNDKTIEEIKKYLHLIEESVQNDNEEVFKKSPDVAICDNCEHLQTDTNICIYFHFNVISYPAKVKKKCNGEYFSIRN